VSVTKNEVLTALNKADDFVRGLVLVDGDRVEPPRYASPSFSGEPNLRAQSVNYDLPALLARATEPM
jgi:hypothetical protein